jgi:FkbM family methyltransferase
MFRDIPVVGRIKNLLDVLQVYGVVDGISTVAGLTAARLSRQTSYDMQVPHSPARVRLRLPAEDDFRVFTDIFVRSCYGLDEFPQTTRAMSGSGELLIIDCGANIGCSTLWFSQRYPDATIVAVEPERGNFDLLCQNVGKRANVEPMCAAVWDSKAELAIVGSSTWAYRTTPAECAAEQARRTPTVTIDEILERHRSAKRVIVKIDVEGAEGTIFRDRPAWLDHVDILIAELHDWMLPWQGTAARVLSSVTRYSMDVVIAGECVICFRDRQLGAS